MSQSDPEPEGDGLASRVGDTLRAYKWYVLAGGLAMVFIFIFRPWFQPIYYALAFKYIGTVVYAVITLLIAAGVFRVRHRFGFKRRVALNTVVTVFAIATIISIGAADVYTDEALAAEMNETTEVSSELMEVSEIEQGNTRTLTLKGAETQADTSFNKPTHTLTRGDLVMHDGDLATSQAIAPEGIYKSVVRQQEGAVFVPINTAKPNVTEVNENFVCGRGMLIFDDVKFVMQKDHMNTQLVRPQTIQDQNTGSLYNVFSGIQHDRRLGIENGFPSIYAVPEFSGVYVSDADCNQEHLTPEEALQDERLEDQQFYPYNLMQKRVLATNLQHGWINTITEKRGMKELPRLNSIDNEPPFTLRTDDGLKQVITMEAIGSGTGVFEVYVADARTGEMTKYVFDTTKKGPGYAVDATITADSEKFGDDPDKLTVSEVYPVVRNGELWYQMNAVQSQTGVYGYTTFYNADSGTLLKAYTDEQVAAFYAGSNEQNEKPENVVEVPSEGQADGRIVDNPVLWVNVTNEDGEVVYPVPVAGNETVTIDHSAPTNSTDTGN